MNQKRYILQSDPSGEVIVDIIEKRNIFFLSASGFGTKKDVIKLAHKVVRFLNKEDETNAPQ